MKFIYLLMTCLFLTSQFTYAVEASEEEVREQPTYGTPWLVQTDQFMMAVFSVPLDQVGLFMPDDISPFINEQGEANVTLEIYHAPTTVGIAPYSLAFVVVDMADAASRTGVPGHYAIWGGVLEKDALSYLDGQLGFPYVPLESFAISMNEDGNSREPSARGAGVAPSAKNTKQESSGIATASLATSKGEQLTLTLLPDNSKPFSGQGVVDMWVSRPAKARSEVSFVSRGYMANVQAFSVNAPSQSGLSVLSNKQPLWALIADDQTFTYSRMLPAMAD